MTDDKYDKWPSSNLNSAAPNIAEQRQKSSGSANGLLMSMKSSSNTDKQPSFDGISTNFLLNGPTQQIAAILELAERVQHLETTIHSICHSLPNLNRPTELKRVHLDGACMKLFITCPEPTPVQLNQVVSELETQFPRHDRRELLSLIRRWFRKRREDVGIRMVAALKKSTPQVKERRSEITRKLQDDRDTTLTNLIEEARFSFPVYEVMAQFCKQKLLTYLQRL